MGWLRFEVSFMFVKEPNKRDDILQTRPMILRRLLIVATPYRDTLFKWCNDTTFVITDHQWLVLMGRSWQTAGLEEAGRGAPGARKEAQNPCPESTIHIARTVTVRFVRPSSAQVTFVSELEYYISKSLVGGICNSTTERSLTKNPRLQTADRII